MGNSPLRHHRRADDDTAITEARTRFVRRVAERTFDEKAEEALAEADEGTDRPRFQMEPRESHQSVLDMAPVEATDALLRLKSAQRGDVTSARRPRSGAAQDASVLPARVHIGRNWGTPMTQKDEPEIVTTGPYHLVRHPVYSGILLALVGTAVALSWLWLIAVGLAGVYFVYSATVEERYLAEQLPDAYPAYKQSTKMLVPFIFWLLGRADEEERRRSASGSAAGEDGHDSVVAGVVVTGQPSDPSQYFGHIHVRLP